MMLGRVGAWGAALFLLFQISGPADAQPPAYPSKPITLVVGIAAGSTTDVTARSTAKRLSERLKQPVIIDNRAGAGGTIAAAFVANAQPDGYTLLWGTSSIPLFPHMYDNLSFDPIGGLVGVGAVSQGGLFMLTRPDAPWKNLAELVAYGKSRKPGAITYASAGIGSNAYLSAEVLAKLVGVEFLHIPYKGSPAALADVVSGRVDFVFDGAASAIPQAESGKLRALGYTGDQRSPFMSSVPTLHEAGAKGFSLQLWQGVFAPAGTPKAIVDRLSNELQTLVGEASFKQEMAATFSPPMKMSGPELSALVRKEHEEWTTRLKALKLK